MDNSFLLDFIPDKNGLISNQDGTNYSLALMIQQFLYLNFFAASNIDNERKTVLRWSCLFYSTTHTIGEYVDQWIVMNRNYTT